ncbi:bifunctional 3-dehydroquinate synthase/phosphatase [Dissulfurispira thermophila]|uniref:Bifunctional 3-dehydroquinate synthase/phosphatase n=1 Tax=Dissulfurispira thermophila TaxID=2715679 RepID=A0A7G1H3H0_9BACT|nr:Ppx/GppA phosphatase family protein [Dissulfurispira thermophila]BCB96267.1 bifunctional 3-dehydroquinate synthase/phosphatase [Dissulfurispira thermophila]
MLSARQSHFSKKYTKDIYSDLIAVIDIGTNTIRFLVGYMKRGNVVRITTDRSVTRLGKDLQKTGTLNKENIKKSIRYIIKLKKLCEEYGVQKIIAVGTSALREANNSEEFLFDVKRNTGIDIEIISGQKEAELTLKGIISSLPDFNNILPLLLVDIGGGSTEWILYNAKYKMQNNTESRNINPSLNMGSVPIGAVKLSESFIKHDPPTPNELMTIKKFLLEKFSNLSLLISCPLLNLIATGGTATTIAAIDMNMNKYDGDIIHLHRISIHTINAIYKRLIALHHEERGRIKGLETERADIIIPGTLILLIFMEVLNIKEVIVSDYGLLEGAIINYHVL